MRVCVYACMRVCVYEDNMGMCVCVSVCMCVCVYVCTGFTDVRMSECTRIRVMCIRISWYVDILLQGALHTGL